MRLSLKTHRIDISNLLAGIFGVCLGGLWLYHSMQIPARRSFDINFFPNIFSAGLIISSLYVIISAWKRTSEEEVGQVKPRESTLHDYIRVASVVLFTVLYVILMPRIGYLISTIVFLISLLTVFGNHKPVPVICVGVGFPVILYLVFSKILSVFLP